MSEQLPLALVVEDDPDLSDLFAEALRNSGFRVEALRSGRAAQQRLGEVVPAVVVLDLTLPFVSGEQLLAQVRGDIRLAGTRVIISSAEGHRTEALHDQADLVLVKPVSGRQLSELALRLADPVWRGG